MSEGNVYHCRWKRVDETFRVWVHRRPSLAAEAETLDDALQELSGVVCLKTGDGEAVFELDPPGEGDSQSDRLVALSGNAYWEPPTGFSLEDFGRLYEGGVCRTCFTGIGPRSKVPLPVGTFGNADLLMSMLSLPRVTLASATFREMFSDRERARVEWVPVEVRGRSRQVFFELRSRRPVQTVMDKSKPSHGWRCPDCNFAYCYTDLDHEYVAKADLTKSVVGITIIAAAQQDAPAISYFRWAELRGQRGTRNVAMSEVVALPSTHVRRRPDLRLLTRSDMRETLRLFRYYTAAETSR